MSSATSTGADALAINGGTPACAQPVAFMAPRLTKEDVAGATAVLESGMLRAASRCAELEERWAKTTDANHAMTCSNGTCALQLAYEPLIERGDDVIVPAWTYIATASMLVARGANPIFCDPIEDTFQIDVEDAEKRLTPKTTAIACTHLYGMPVDIEAVQDLANRKGLKVIYDGAQAHLARYDGKGIGAYGDAVTYSFYATKNLGTGEGGMITANDDALARKIGLLRSHGETDKYLHESIGYNYRMNDITGAIGCSKLDRLGDETARRQQVADLYDARLAEIDAVAAPVRTAKAEPVWHLYTVRLDLSKLTCTRDEFCAALKEEGVPTAVHYPRALTRQPAFAQWAQDMPVSDRLAQCVLCLPMHQELTDEQAGWVCDAVAKIARAFAS